jgi:hypothetical protein
MKDWNDFIPNDEENEHEDDLFGINQQQQLHDKLMFLQDIQRGLPIPIDPIEYEALFGDIQEVDINELTQAFFHQYHRLGVKVDTLVDVWGFDWIWLILKNCERTEEFELCSIIMCILDEYSNPHMKDTLKAAEISTSV